MIAPSRALLLAAATLLLVTSCSRMTAENLAQIHNGMTRDEVKKIMGTPMVFEVRPDLWVFSGAGEDAAREHNREVMASGQPPLKTIYYYNTSSSRMEIDFARDAVVAKKETKK